MTENNVAIKQCGEVRVYLNVAGYLCIAQTYPDGEEAVIAIWPEHAAQLAKAIQEAAQGESVE